MVEHASRLPPYFDSGLVSVIAVSLVIEISLFLVVLTVTLIHPGWRHQTHSPQISLAQMQAHRTNNFKRKAMMLFLPVYNGVKVTIAQKDLHILLAGIDAKKPCFLNLLVDRPCLFLSRLFLKK